jgi:hypothetical protein
MLEIPTFTPEQPTTTLDTVAQKAETVVDPLRIEDETRFDRATNSKAKIALASVLGGLALSGIATVGADRLSNLIAPPARRAIHSEAPKVEVPGGYRLVELSGRAREAAKTPELVACADFLDSIQVINKESLAEADPNLLVLLDGVVEPKRMRELLDRRQMTITNNLDTQERTFDLEAYHKDQERPGASVQVIVGDDEKRIVVSSQNIQKDAVNTMFQVGGLEEGSREQDVCFTPHGDIGSVELVIPKRSS